MELLYFGIALLCVPVFAKIFIINFASTSITNDIGDYVFACVVASTFALFWPIVIFIYVFYKTIGKRLFDYTGKFFTENSKSPDKEFDKF